MNDALAAAIGAAIVNLVNYAGTLALPIDETGEPNGPMDLGSPPMPVQYPCFLANSDHLVYREFYGEAKDMEKRPHVIYFTRDAWGVISVGSGVKIAGIWYKCDAPMQEEFIDDKCVYFGLAADEW